MVEEKDEQLQIEKELNVLFKPEVADEERQVALSIIAGRMSYLSKFATQLRELAVGFGAKVFRVDSQGAWLGAEKFTDAPFRVDMEGNMVATSVTLSGYIAVGGAAEDVNAGETNIEGTMLEPGTVTADYVVAEISITTPAISGGSMEGTTLLIGADNTVFKADENGIYLGHAVFASAPFSVSMAGALVAMNATITGAIQAGSTITSSSFYGGLIAIGEGSAIFKADANGIYLGSNTFASAPFRVDMGGGLWAAYATIQGNILSSTITGSTIVGGIVETSTGGSRVELNGDDNSIAFYYGGGLRGKIRGGNEGGMKVEGSMYTSGISYGFGARQHTNSYFTMYVNPNSPYWNVLQMSASNKWMLMSEGGASKVSYDTASELFHTAGNFSAGGYLMTQGGTLYFLDGNRYISTDGNMFIVNASGSDRVVNFYRNGYLKGYISNDSWVVGNVYAGGSKPFIIPHPDGSDRFLRYAAVESPEVALSVRGVAKLKEGKVIIKLPTHFTLITESKGLITAQLTPMGDCKGLFVKNVSNSEVQIQECGGGTSNAEVSWEVKAVRKGYLNWPVEIPKSDIPDHPFNVGEGKKLILSSKKVGGKK